MTIGVLKAELFIPDSNSLKAKRMVLHSLTSRLRNSFNVAVSQIADEDKWQKAGLAVVCVGKNRSHLDSMLCRVKNFIEAFGPVSLLDYEIELL